MRQFNLILLFKDQIVKIYFICGILEQQMKIQEILA